MMSDNGYIDGSWQLNINVTDLNVDIALRVKGDLHIGGVMLQLVEALGKLSSQFLFLFFVFSLFKGGYCMNCICINNSSFVYI